MLTRLALLVAAYLSLDVSNPMMPGALTFGVEESVEVRPSDRFRGPDPDVALVPRVPDPERVAPSDDALALRRVSPAPRSRPAAVTRSRLALPAPTPPAEDH